MKFALPLLAVACWVASGAVCAAPYAITYVGDIRQVPNPIPGVYANERYQATFVMDNGGHSVNDQTWTGAQLTCVIFRINNAGDVVVKHDMVATPPLEAIGTITTDGQGRLSQMLDVFNSGDLQAGSYTATGVALVPPIAWLGDNHLVLADWGAPPDGFTSRVLADRGGRGLPNVPSRWSAPYPVSGLCDDTPAAGPGTVAPVPTLGAWGLGGLIVALGLSVGALRWGCRHRRGLEVGYENS